MDEASLGILQQRVAAIRLRIRSYQALLVDYEAVIADLEKDKGRRVPKTRRKVVKGVEGKLATAFMCSIPPSVKVKIQAPETWDGKAPIPEVLALENAARDAAFYLYGRRTGPGYSVSLKPPRLDNGWIMTRIIVIPQGEEHRERLGKKLTEARDRALAALTKAGAKLLDPAPVSA